MTHAAEIRFPQEDDRVRTRAAVWWIIGGVAMVLIGVGWAWAMMAVRGAPPPIHEGRGYGTTVPEFAGGLHTGTFESDGSPRSSASSLTRFEWADQQGKIVRIPVGDAMDLWLARHGARPTPEQRATR